MGISDRQAEDEIRLFRIIAGATPQRSDFLSDQAMGKPEPTDPYDRRNWVGFSTRNSLARARSLARRGMGTHIAEIAIGASSHIAYEQTYRRDHYTVWGDPDVCLASVVAVYPVATQEDRVNGND
jgi:hypothetical protein